MTGSKTKKKDSQNQKSRTDIIQTISQAQRKSIKSSRASSLAPTTASKTSSQASSRCATVEASNDDEGGSNGGTLDKDGDAIMELASDSHDKGEEDEESELRMSMLLLVSCITDYFEERLTKEWTAPIYAFFLPTPVIEYIKGRHCHAFRCAAKSCQHYVRRFLDTGDAKSTSNMWKHAKKCWSADVISDHHG